MGKTLTIEFSNEEVQLLKDINKEGYAEYRDPEYETVQDFVASPDFQSNTRTVESFKARNFNGTYHLIDKLLKHSLIQMDDMGWHTTFVMTDDGKAVLTEWEKE